MTLRPGLPLLEAVRRGFAAAGFTSGVAAGRWARARRPSPMSCRRSRRRRSMRPSTARPSGPPGVTRIETGALTFGLRDGAPFFHCHGALDGSRRQAQRRPCPARRDGGGRADHAAGGRARRCELRGRARCRDEFQAVRPGAGAVPRRDAEGRFFALRVRPNIDLAGALEEFCAERGIERAVIHGGVGSTIGARFEDGGGRRELRHRGRDHGAADHRRWRPACAEIDVALVDFTGATAERPAEARRQPGADDLRAGAGGGVGRFVATSSEVPDRRGNPLPGGRVG